MKFSLPFGIVISEVYDAPVKPLLKDIQVAKQVRICDSSSLRDFESTVGFLPHYPYYP